jgi:hypothetical protein
MLNKFYIVLATAILGLYAAQGITGWEFGSPDRKVVPADSRRSPGWSRTGTAHVWFSGYRGGK